MRGQEPVLITGHLSRWTVRTNSSPTMLSGWNRTSPSQFLHLRTVESAEKTEKYSISHIKMCGSLVEGILRSFAGFSGRLTLLFRPEIFWCADCHEKCASL